MKLVQVRAVGSDKVYLRYGDGSEGEVDISEVVGKGVFTSLTEAAYFAQVGIGSSGEITWGGDLELCSDAMYMRLTGKQPEDVFPLLAAESVMPEPAGCCNPTAFELRYKQIKLDHA